MKLGFYALLLAAARAGALPQRARAMCEARARGVASLRQLFSDVCVAGLCMPPRARKTQGFPAARGRYYPWIDMRECLRSADAARRSMQAVFQR